MARNYVAERLARKMLVALKTRERRHDGITFVPDPRTPIGVLDKAIDLFHRNEEQQYWRATLFRDGDGITKVNIMF